jgi:hypothetical protein
MKQKGIFIMTNISESLIQRGTYLGYFMIESHTTKPSKKGLAPMTFKRPKYYPAPGYSKADSDAMGDIVYGLYVKEALHKIGKAGSSGKWWTRATLYGNYPNGAQKEGTETYIGEGTNHKLCETHLELYDADTPIDVYGFSVPPLVGSFRCPISNQTVRTEAPQNHTLETELTALAIEQDEDLIYSTNTC